MAAQAKNENGIVIQIPGTDAEIGISNGALKILKEIAADAERWTHENPFQLGAILFCVCVLAYFSTQRIKARVQMKRDFRETRSRNRQYSLDFKSKNGKSSPSKTTMSKPTKPKGDGS